MNVRAKSWAVALETPDEVPDDAAGAVFLSARRELLLQPRNLCRRFGRAIALLLKLLLQQRSIVWARLLRRRFLRLQLVTFGCHLRQLLLQALDLIEQPASIGVAQLPILLELRELVLAALRLSLCSLDVARQLLEASLLLRRRRRSDLILEPCLLRLEIPQPCLRGLTLGRQPLILCRCLGNQLILAHVAVEQERDRTDTHEQKRQHDRLAALCAGQCLCLAQFAVSLLLLFTPALRLFATALVEKRQHL